MKIHKNQQGDILAITDADAQVVAKYRYDAWGVCTVAEDTTEDKVASINPFRYRGYYYDAETELYYLQSRYYDASVGRFVNGDRPDFSVTFTQLEINRYTYCINNPINNFDVLGNIAYFLLKKSGTVIVNAVISFIAQILGDVLMSAIKRKWSVSSVGSYISAVAKGAWDGLWGGGIAKEICKSMLSNILSQLIDKLFKKKKKFDFASLFSSVFDGIFSYAVSKIVIVPRYIKHIKYKARAKGIKGTYMLMQYLHKEIWKKLSFTLTLSGIFNFVTQLIEETINGVISYAKKLYNELKKEIGGLKIA